MPHVISRGTKALICLLIAIALQVVIVIFFPGSIDRSLWAVAFMFSSARNGFLGGALGSIVNQTFLGLIAGVLVIPILLVFVFGLPC